MDVKITNIRDDNRDLTLLDKSSNLTHRRLQPKYRCCTYRDLFDRRWLRVNGNCLQRFFALSKEIPIFLKDEVRFDTIQNQMVDLQFLADLLHCKRHFNELNFILQGKQQNTANLFGHINKLENKMNLFKSLVD